MAKSTSLRCRVLEGKDLPAKDVSGSSDPYCVVKVDNEVVARTATVWKSLNPFWGEEYTLRLPRGFRSLAIYVLDEDTIGHDDVIGKVSLSHQQISAQPRGIDSWLSLAPVDPDEEVQGEIQLEVQVPEQGHPRVLRCHLIGARDLAPRDPSGTSDPFARVSCCGHTQETAVIKKTRFPRWDEVLEFELAEGELGDTVLSVEVWDWDMVGKNDFLGRVELPVGTPGATKGWFQLLPFTSSTEEPGGRLGSLRVAVRLVEEQVLPPRCYQPLIQLLAEPIRCPGQGLAVPFLDYLIARELARTIRGDVHEGGGAALPARGPEARGEPRLRGEEVRGAGPLQDGAEPRQEDFLQGVPVGGTGAGEQPGAAAGLPGGHGRCHRGLGGEVSPAHEGGLQAAPQAGGGAVPLGAARGGALLLHQRLPLPPLLRPRCAHPQTLRPAGAARRPAHRPHAPAARQGAAEHRQPGAAAGQGALDGPAARRAAAQHHPRQSLPGQPGGGGRHPRRRGAGAGGTSVPHGHHQGGLPARARGRGALLAAAPLRLQEEGPQARCRIPVPQMRAVERVDEGTFPQPHVMQVVAQDGAGQLRTTYIQCKVGAPTPHPWDTGDTPLQAQHPRVPPPRTPATSPGGSEQSLGAVGVVPVPNAAPLVVLGTVGCQPRLYGNTGVSYRGCTGVTGVPDQPVLGSVGYPAVSVLGSLGYQLQVYWDHWGIQLYLHWGHSRCTGVTRVSSYIYTGVTGLSTLIVLGSLGYPAISLLGSLQLYWGHWGTQLYPYWGHWDSTSNYIRAMGKPALSILGSLGYQPCLYWVYWGTILVHTGTTGDPSPPPQCHLPPISNPDPSAIKPPLAVPAVPPLWGCCGVEP
ncbi:rasGAP-activating-like protein 1 isoform X10 [Anas acuta]|uniref:rasGAP-activating-like protein 1 isoform X10 n=1 Tax=Anas acuta TaxID=28680 RepID=UPI0035C8DA01